MTRRCDDCGAEIIGAAMHGAGGTRCEECAKKFGFVPVKRNPNDVDSGFQCRRTSDRSLESDKDR